MALQQNETDPTLSDPTAASQAGTTHTASDVQTNASSQTLPLDEFLAELEGSLASQATASASSPGATQAEQPRAPSTKSSAQATPDALPAALPLMSTLFASLGALPEPKPVVAGGAATPSSNVSTTAGPEDPLVLTATDSNGATTPAASAPAADPTTLTKLFTETLASPSEPDAGSPTRDLAAPAQSAAGATASVDPSASAALASLHASSFTRSAASVDPASQHALSAPVGSDAWTDELGDHLTLMAQQGNESASLQLSPPDLGPIEVRIAVHDSQASVWFGAAHPDTRDSLQQALPRLRELFAGQGIALADAGVFREPPRQQPQTPAAGASALSQSSDAAPAPQSVTRARIGLIDTYA